MGANNPLMVSDNPMHKTQSQSPAALMAARRVEWIKNMPQTFCWNARAVILDTESHGMLIEGGSDSNA
jgi:hypothetical protein